ncbi:hypothetical protein O6X71_05360 [Sphingomonas faeni]
MRKYPSTVRFNLPKRMAIGIEPKKNGTSRADRGVLVASLVLQLFALATSLIVQVVIDKLLVQKGPNTLNALAVALMAWCKDPGVPSAVLREASLSVEPGELLLLPDAAE